MKKVVIINDHHHQNTKPTNTTKCHTHKNYKMSRPPNYKMPRPPTQLPEGTANEHARQSQPVPPLHLERSERKKVGREGND